MVIPPHNTEIRNTTKALEERSAKLKAKREEVERKARRGEIDPMHEHALQLISQVFINSISHFHLFISG